jgi:hypothetical protein
MVRAPRVYVSSPYTDLAEYRKEVIAQIGKLGCEVVAMEDSRVDTAPLVKKCLDDVVQCELYICILAWRYGSIPRYENPEQLSMTELEYQRAWETRKTCHIFLLDENVPWPVHQVDPDRRRIDQFRSRLSEHHYPGRFKSLEHLGTQVAASVSRWMEEWRFGGTMTAKDAPARSDGDDFFSTWQTPGPMYTVRVNWRRRSTTSYAPEDLSGPPIIVAANAAFMALAGFLLDAPVAETLQAASLTTQGLLERLAQQNVIAAEDFAEFLVDQQRVSQALLLQAPKLVARIPLKFNDNHPDEAFRRARLLPYVVGKRVRGDPAGAHSLEFLVAFVDVP